MSSFLGLLSPVLVELISLELLGKEESFYRDLVCLKISILRSYFIDGLEERGILNWKLFPLNFEDLAPLNFQCCL